MLFPDGAENYLGVCLMASLFAVYYVVTQSGHDGLGMSGSLPTLASSRHIAAVHAPFVTHIPLKYDMTRLERLIRAEQDERKHLMKRWLSHSPQNLLESFTGFEGYAERRLGLTNFASGRPLRIGAVQTPLRGNGSTTAEMVVTRLKSVFSDLSYHTYSRCDPPDSSTIADEREEFVDILIIDSGVIPESFWKNSTAAASIYVIDERIGITHQSALFKAVSAAKVATMMMAEMTKEREIRSESNATTTKKRKHHHHSHQKKKKKVDIRNEEMRNRLEADLSAVMRGMSKHTVEWPIKCTLEADIILTHLWRVFQMAAMPLGCRSKICGNRTRKK